MKASFIPSHKQLHRRVFLSLFGQAFHAAVTEAAEAAHGNHVAGFGGMPRAFAQPAGHENFPGGKQGLRIAPAHFEHMGHQRVHPLGRHLHQHPLGFKQRALRQLLDDFSGQRCVPRLDEMLRDIRRDALLAKEIRRVLPHHNIAQQFPFHAQRHQGAQVVPVGQGLGELRAEGRKAQDGDGKGLAVAAQVFAAEAQHLPFAPLRPAEQRPGHRRQGGNQRHKIRPPRQVQKMGEAVNALPIAAVRQFGEPLFQCFVHGAFPPVALIISSEAARRKPQPLAIRVFS